MITESMALKHTAKLYPEIPRVSTAKATDMVHLMIDYEVGNYKLITGKYNEWISKSKPLEPVFSGRRRFLLAISVPFYLIANLLSLDPLAVIGLLVKLKFESFTEFGYGWAYGTFSYNQGWTGLLRLLASLPRYR